MADLISKVLKKAFLKTTNPFSILNSQWLDDQIMNELSNVTKVIINNIGIPFFTINKTVKKPCRNNSRDEVNTWENKKEISIE